MVTILFLGLCISIFGLISIVTYLIITRRKYIITLPKIKKEKQTVLELLDQILTYAGGMINLEQFFFMELFFLVIVIIAAFRNEIGINRILYFAKLEFLFQFVILGGIYSKINRRNKVLIEDICEIHQVLFFQSDAGISLDQLLLSAYDTLQDKQLKDVINRIAVSIINTEGNTREEIERLKYISNVSAVKSFSGIMMKNFISGQMKGSVTAQLNTLTRQLKHKELLKQQSRRFVTAIYAVLLILVYACILIIPLLTETKAELFRLLQ